MKMSNWKKLTIFALIALFAVSVGVLVYPTPKEAKAVDATFQVEVDWVAFDDPEPDPGYVTVIVRTYSDAAHLIMIDEEEAVYDHDANGLSVFVASFMPNSQSAYWGATLTCQHTQYTPTGPSIVYDDDNVNTGGANFLGDVGVLHVMWND